MELSALRTDNSCIISYTMQKIIDPTGTETSAKKPKIVKLLRELKSTPVSHNKKVHWFFSHVCNGKFAVLQLLCCGMTCKWVLFPTIDLYFYWLAQISEIDNGLVTACIIKTATGVQCQCFTLEKALLCPCLFVSRRRFCLCAPQQIG